LGGGQENQNTTLLEQNKGVCKIKKYDERTGKGRRKEPELHVRT